MLNQSVYYIIHQHILEMNKGCFTLIFCLLIYTLTSSAQTGWQWGKRGGSPEGGTTTEGEVEMVTDANGNLYLLAVLSEGSPANIDGNISDSANNRLSLTKWDCNGAHIWTKIFGGTGSMGPIGSSLAIDSLGGLYFTGTTLMDPTTVNGSEYIYFDIDVSPFHSPKSWYIVKYDTSGIFQWLRMPQADTVTLFGSAHNSTPIGLDVAPSGDVYVLAHLAPGVYSDDCVIAANGFWLMRYNKDGDFLDVKEVDMSVSITGIEPDLVNLKDQRTGFVRDHNSGRFYLSGNYTSDWGSLTFGSTSISDGSGGYPMYFAAFGNSGNSLWVEQSSPSGWLNVPYSRPRIDEQGNIYICGAAEQGNLFFGHTYTNSISSLFGTPFILSVDSTGSLRWARNAENDYSPMLRGICYANGVVSVSDRWMHFLSWKADTVTASLADVFNHIAHFNAHTGTPVKNIDTFRMTGVGPGTTDLIADKKGNIYVGGSLPYQVLLPSVTLEKLGGGYNDFFVAKYGSADCDCVLPVPDFTYSSASGSTTVNFTYTGTGGTVDSVRWEFGDGAMVSGFTASHTYAAAGTYEVSIVIYSPCGIKVIAQQVTTGGGTGITVPGLSSQLIVYPNPAHQHLTIDKSTAGTAVEIYNSTGQRMLSHTTTLPNETIDISSLSSGMYIISLRTQDGRQGSVKFVKE